RELIQNGSFENGATAWRIIGNHRGEVVVDPDNPANQVLHLIARGPTEHMHNHAETTLASGATVLNGREYQISFRAKWLAGANQLHTRLYLNRLAQVTLLDIPQLNGTPGARNSRFETNIGPTFADFQHRPVVPQANQPVTVSVRAEDPDGAGRCMPWWSANGGAWTNAAMTSADAAVLHAHTNVMSNGQMGATVVYDEQEVFYDLGVRLQSSERGRDEPSRVGFTIEFHPDQLFRGVHDSVTIDRSGGYSNI